MRPNDEQLRRWRTDGWLHLPGAVPVDLVASLSDWVDDVAGWAATGGPGLHHHEATDRGPALARSECIVGNHESLTTFIAEGAIPALAGALLGEPAVLFKEKINYKQPGGAGFAPHQDAPAYRFVDHHVSVMVPLDPATTESGCLEVAPGHRRGLLPNDAGRIAPDVVATLDWRPVPVEPGDLLAFDSYTPHRSGTNSSDAPRRALYLTYNAASKGEWRSTYYDDKQTELDLDGAMSASGRVRLSISDDFLGRPLT